jgi:hypothetical protein
MTSASSLSRISLACLASVIRPTQPTYGIFRIMFSFKSFPPGFCKIHENAWDLLLNMSGKRYLVSRSDRDLLASVVASRTDVDEIDTTVS